MIMTRFSYLKLTAVVAALGMALIPPLRPSTAKSQPSPVATVAAGADLANEERVIGKYCDDLVAYDKQITELGKRGRFVSADLDPFQRKSDDLKGRLSGIQNTVREIVRKLKAANEWKDLDTSVAARIADANKRAFLRETSFKQDLEEASNSLNANEISTPLDNLRKRLTSRYSTRGDLQIVRASYEAPMTLCGQPGLCLSCRLGRIRLKLIDHLGGSPTTQALHDQFENCHHAGATNPF